MIAYRICERKKGKLLTLFHGINGSRVMPINQWMNATIKPVSDGSRKTSKVYYSGFHCLRTLDECRDFTRKFRAPRDLVIVECEVEGMRDKTHSPSNVLLTDRMKLIRVVEEVKLKNK